MKKSKWLSLIVLFFAVFLILCIVLTYVVDPFFQFRVKDHSYVINCRYCASGLIKNYDYDTLILGSSMTQNFDMDLFREKLNVKPLHIGIGDMSDEDILLYHGLSKKVGKSKNYYINIDISQFTGKREPNVINYLLNDDIISRLGYCVSHASLFRYIPIDLSVCALKKMNKVPLSYNNRIDIDKFGYWGDQYTYDEQMVLDGYKTGKNKVSEIDLENLSERMTNGIDAFLKEFDFGDSKYTFFFPPYSSLFWSHAQKKGYFDTYLEAKAYFIDKATRMGATVYDFQSEDFTMDLNNYKDTTHFSPKINDFMVECFSENHDIVTNENYYEFKEKLIENTENFKKRVDFK